MNETSFEKNAAGGGGAGGGGVAGALIRAAGGVLALPAAMVAWLFAAPLLRTGEWLALAGGLAAVMIAGAGSLARARRIVAAFVLFLFVVVFTDLRSVTPVGLKHALAASQFGPSVLAFGAGLFTSLGFAAVLALTAVLGRVYCSVLCPLGILQDVFFRIASQWREFGGAVRMTAGGQKIKKFKLKYAPPAAVLRWSVLAATLVVLAIGGASALSAWLDPYSQFGRIAAAILRPAAVVANNVVVSIAETLGVTGTAFARDVFPWAGVGALVPPVVIVSVIGVLSALRGRIYCNAFCPIGTLLGVVSKRALFRISIDKTSCIRCGHCVAVCKAQCIDLKTQEVDAARCVACFNCMPVCDDHGILPNLWGRAEAKGKRVPKGTPAAVPAASPAASSRRKFLAGVGAGAVVAGGHFAARVIGRGGAGENGVVAPPGALNRTRFVECCTACQLCVSACPSHVLEPALFEYGMLGGLGGLAGVMKPRLNFSKNYCQIECTACMDVCPDGALRPMSRDEKYKTRIGVAKLDIEKCIVRRDNTACGACGEHCPTGALTFGKGKAKFDEPRIDESVCIGCGACEYACPALTNKLRDPAIVIHGVEEHTLATPVKSQKIADPNAGADFAF